MIQALKFVADFFCFQSLHYMWDRVVIVLRIIYNQSHMQKERIDAILI